MSDATVVVEAMAAALLAVLLANAVMAVIKGRGGRR